MSPLQRMQRGHYAASTQGHIAGWLHPEADADPGANLARRFASLDLLANGHCSWNLVPSGNPNEPVNLSTTA